MVDKEQVDKVRKVSSEISDAISGVIDKVTVKTNFGSQREKRPEKKESSKKTEEEEDDSQMISDRISILEKRMAKLEKKLSQHK